MTDIDAGLERGRRGRGTPTKGQEVVDMWEAGITDVAEIAIQTGKSRGQVAVFLRQAGYEVYPGRQTLVDRYSDTELEELLDDYYVRRMRVWELVEKWDFADNASFYNLIRKLGKQPRSRTKGFDDGRKFQLDHAIQLYDEELDMPIADISIETGVDPAVINMEVKRRGIVLRSRRNKDISKPG